MAKGFERPNHPGPAFRLRPGIRAGCEIGTVRLIIIRAGRQMRTLELAPQIGQAFRFWEVGEAYKFRHASSCFQLMKLNSMPL